MAQIDRQVGVDQADPREGQKADNRDRPGGRQAPHVVEGFPKTRPHRGRGSTWLPLLQIYNSQRDEQGRGRDDRGRRERPEHATPTPVIGKPKAERYSGNCRNGESDGRYRHDAAARSIGDGVGDDRINGRGNGGRSDPSHRSSHNQNRVRRRPGGNCLKDDEDGGTRIENDGAARPAEDNGDPGAHGTSSSLPVVLRLSMSAWAFAASASRYSPPARTLSLPSAIQSNSCADRTRNSSGVWIWS